MTAIHLKNRKYVQSALLMSLLLASFGGAWAQQAPAAAAVATLTAPVIVDGDSIEQRAKRKSETEAAEARANWIKDNPAAAAAQANASQGAAQPKVVKIAVPRAEFYVEAIRGFDDSLEAALVINGKRVTGSKTYPTLTEGWVISAISDHGVTITNTKGKTRQTQSLAFVGPEPYLPVMSDMQGVASNVAPSTGGAMPAGRPGSMLMPVGR